MRLSLSVPLSVMASVTLVLTVVADIAIDRSFESIRWAKDKQMEAVAATVNSTLREAGHNAMAQAELIAGMPGVSDAVAKSDVDWLKGMAPDYQRQRAKYGIDGASFVLPPATMLLRLHDLSRAGDDQSQKRPLLVTANTMQVPMSGLEISSTTIGMRGTAPVSSNGTHVGTVEWAIGLFRIAQEIHDSTNSEITFFIDRSRVEGNRLAEERLIGPMSGMVATDWELATSVVTPVDLEPFNGDKILYRNLHGTAYGIVHVPLYDFSSQRVGTVVAVRDVSEFTRAENTIRSIVITVVLV